MDGQCLKNCLLGGLNIHKFDEHFIKNYDEDSDKEIFLK